MLIWIISAGAAMIWLVLTLLFHKGGYVHIFLIAAISIFGVQLMAWRKAQYHKNR
jgi:Flp pilus assembly protein TadB